MDKIIKIRHAKILKITKAEKNSEETKQTKPTLDHFFLHKSRIFKYVFPRFSCLKDYREAMILTVKMIFNKIELDYTVYSYRFLVTSNWKSIVQLIWSENCPHLQKLLEQVGNYNTINKVACFLLKASEDAIY